MAPMFHSRDIAPPQSSSELPRTDIAYISAGSAVFLVFFAITVGWLVRKCRRRRRIRERRMTRDAQREKLHTLDPYGGYQQRSHSFRTTTSNGSFSKHDYQRPSPDERWKWNPPGEPDMQSAIQIPPNAKFF